MSHVPEMCIFYLNESCPIWMRHIALQMSKVTTNVSGWTNTRYLTRQWRMKWVCLICMSQVLIWMQRQWRMRRVCCAYVCAYVPSEWVMTHTHTHTTVSGWTNSRHLTRQWRMRCVCSFRRIWWRTGMSRSSWYTCCSVLQWVAQEWFEINNCAVCCERFDWVAPWFQCVAVCGARLVSCEQTCLAPHTAYSVLCLFHSLLRLSHSLLRHFQTVPISTNVSCATHCWDKCCSVLQCVAVCCSVLQCVAVCRHKHRHKQDTYDAPDRLNAYKPKRLFCKHSVCRRVVLVCTHSVCLVHHMCLVCVCVCVCVFVCLCLCLSVYICVCLCVCLSVWMITAARPSVRCSSRNSQKSTLYWNYYL